MQAIRYADNMGTNPASVDLDTGIITVNRRIWFQLTPVQRKLILYHEQAHVKFDTIDDEILCDRYAIEKFAGTEKNSLKKAVNALLDLIDKDYIDDDRKRSILINALRIDAERFGNKNAEKLLMKLQQNNNKKDAQFIETAAAVVALAATLINVGKAVFGKRSEWSKGANSKRTAYRLEVLEATTDYVVGQIIETYNKDGIDKIKSVIRDYDKFYSSVYTTMRDSGVFADSNILTRSWENESKFFKSNNFGWTKSVMESRAEYQIKRIDELSGNKVNTGNWLKYAALGVLGLLVVKKIM